MSTNTMATANQSTPRPVYVVARATGAGGRHQFISAERTPAGVTLEHSTPEAAHAAAARMGGRGAGFVVLEEWRNETGLRCTAPRVES